MTTDHKRPRDELIEVAMDKLAPHLDTRCTSCVETGVGIASGHDRHSCDGGGIWTAVIEVVDAMIARHMLHGFEENAVLQAAIRLCQDSLGDDALWAATTPLREALTEWNGAPVSTSDDTSGLSTNGDNAR